MAARTRRPLLHLELQRTVLLSFLVHFFVRVVVARFPLVVDGIVGCIRRIRCRGGLAAWGFSSGTMERRVGSNLGDLGYHSRRLGSLSLEGGSEARHQDHGSWSSERSEM
jgi:hypothetical protein